MIHRGFKPKDLEDYLEYSELCDGTIWLIGSIYDNEVDYISKRLSLMKKMGLKNATICISSEGGSVYGALAIYDMIREFQDGGINITAKVNSLAASAAAMILLQAANRRIATPQARFLVHEVRSWKFFSEERASDKKDELKEITTLQEIICKILSKRTGKTPKEIENWFERKEIWLSAQEALEFGLIDEIVKEEK